MLRSLRYLQIFQGKYPRKIPPIDFNRSEISDVSISVRNFWCSCRVSNMNNYLLHHLMVSLPISTHIALFFTCLTLVLSRHDVIHKSHISLDQWVNTGPWFNNCLHEYCSIVKCKKHFVSLIFSVGDCAYCIIYIVQSNHCCTWGSPFWQVFSVARNVCLAALSGGSRISQRRRR